MWNFILTLAARGVAAGGGVVFFAWLALATPAELSAQVTVYVSTTTLIAFLSSAGLNSVALRLISRVPPKWKWAVASRVLLISWVMGCIGAAVGCALVPKLTGESFPPLALLATFFLIAASSFRAVANDVLRALGTVISVAWCEFGQVMAIAGLFILTSAATGRAVDLSAAALALSAAGLGLFSVQLVLLARAYRSVEPHSRATKASLIKLVWSYWRSFGVFSFFIGLLGSGSRDLFVLRYAALGNPASVAAVALALRVWEGLSIPLVAAHSDLSAHVVGKSLQRRTSALANLRKRVRWIAACSWLVAVAISMALCFSELVPARLRGELLIMLAIVTCSRALSSLVGLPVALLSLHGAARQGLVIAAAQMALIFGLLEIPGLRLTGASIVSIWCFSFLVRTVWEYWRLRTRYGVRVDVLAPAT